MSGWIKGKTQCRISYIYISAIHGVEIIEVNAAYTSQSCHVCGHLGVRKDDMFHCHNCDKVVFSGFVAASNVEKRRYDTDITVDMSPSSVLRIIKKRLSDKSQQHSVAASNRANPDQLSP